MRFVVLFGVAFVLGIIMAFLDVSEPLGLIISMIVIVGFSTYLFIYPIFWEKNVRKIESYLEKRRKNPLYKLYYGMGNRIDQDVKEATEELVQKYKQPARQALFKTLHALYEDDILRVKKDIEEIHPPQYKAYYQAIVAVEEGKLEQAAALGEQVKSEWMKHALAAGIAKKAGNHEVYVAEIQKAFEKTRGMQRYVLYKQFERDLEAV
ncbi:hypothetical protein E1I69_21070 [Bacillus timonensis]|uniref:Uncharacterized protein n=1 Tax=Bacillus timonensis TaxID=1033734 RepID=A0A4S3PK30_9BACI|nr:hypothetical protein [Bacillus timonensis]THE09791.1 hypothetical protein E1I69_21070 [Bacillus timonensis]